MWNVRSATSSSYINVPSSNVTLVLLQIYDRKHKHGAISVGTKPAFQWSDQLNRLNTEQGKTGGTKSIFLIHTQKI